MGGFETPPLRGCRWRVRATSMDRRQVSGGGPGHGAHILADFDKAEALVDAGAGVGGVAAVEAGTTPCLRQASSTHCTAPAYFGSS